MFSASEAQALVCDSAGGSSFADVLYCGISVCGGGGGGVWESRVVVNGPESLCVEEGRRVGTVSVSVNRAA